MILTTLTTALAVSTCTYATNIPLRFDDAIGVILKRSTDIGIQETNTDAARAKVLPTKLAFVPTLSFDAKESTNKFGGGPSATSRQVEGTVGLNLFRSGADVSGLKAADAAAASQSYQLDSKILATEDKAIGALVDEIQRSKELDVYQKIAASQAELLRIAQQRYRRGVLPAQEVDKLTIDLDNAQAHVKDADVRKAEASSALTNLLGTADIEIAWPWQERLKTVTTAKAVATAYEDARLPAWNAAKANFESQERLVDRGFRLIFPTIDASFTYGFYKTGTLDNPGSIGILDLDQPGFTGQLAITWPIFDGLNNYTNYRVQVYAREAAALSLEQAHRDGRSEWEIAKKSFETALATVISRDRTLDLSRKVYQGTYDRFKAGRVNANDLFVDQTRLFESELLAVQGWASAHTAYGRLCHALGKRVSE